MGGQINRNKFEGEKKDHTRRDEVRDCVVFGESLFEQREEDDLLQLQTKGKGKSADFVGPFG